ncbi:hypothetical protein [Streptomyces sp. NBC_00986]|uniref:hypothetical protein n=1 Tax=Streptomyces sp. NBC_00986 TaxID=2903702 RepID=UPI00386C003A
METHAQFRVEQPAQGAFARSCRAAQLGQGDRPGGVLVQEGGGGAQPVVTGLGQVQELLGGIGEFVDDHREQSAVRAGPPLRPVGEREEGLAQKGAHREDTGVVHQLRAQIERDDDETHVGLAVEAVGVGEARWCPGDTVGRGDPGPASGHGGQRAGGGVHELALDVRVGVEPVAVREPRAALEDRLGARR